MQYSTPQFIDREQKLLGPLTVNQTVILGLTAVILTIFYFIFNFFIFSVLLVLLGSISIAVSFIKINDRPVYKFITSFFGYFLKPRVYMWEHEDKQTQQVQSPAKQGQAPAKATEKITTEKDIKDLAQFLDK